ncbi:MAG: hypothetical protein QNK31_09090 [Porticoccus sp.]|nr:hypothetical protein [Porticoccus sp.]
MKISIVPILFIHRAFFGDYLTELAFPLGNIGYDTPIKAFDQAIQTITQGANNVENSGNEPKRWLRKNHHFHESSELFQQMR